MSKCKAVLDSRKVATLTVRTKKTSAKKAK